MPTHTAPAVNFSVSVLSERPIGELLRIEWLAAAAIALRLAGTVQAWRQNVRTRAALARMGEREWRDIGLSRGDVPHEVGKPFWIC